MPRQIGFARTKCLSSDAARSVGARSCGNIHLQEPDMPQEDKSDCTDKQKRQAGAIEKGHEQKRVARPAAEARSWATVNKLHGGSKKIGSGRKVPNGPVGGSGRKTNLSRSS
ncbi:MAG: hypothetical protein ABWZ54_04965 [Luteibacter sp.]